MITKDMYSAVEVSSMSPGDGATLVLSLNMHHHVTTGRESPRHVGTSAIRSLIKIHMRAMRPPRA